LRRYAPLVVGGLVALVCLRFSVWQFGRLRERRDRNAVIEARLALPPVDFRSDVDTGVASPGTPEAGSWAFRRATASGVFDFDHELVVIARSRRGVPGIHVATPLVMSGGAVILVERGWVASPDARTVDLARLREADTAVVRGVLLEATRLASASRRGQAWPRLVRTALPEVLTGVYPDGVIDLFLRRTTLPETAPTAFRAVPLPELSDGPHLSYAIQWLAFAVIAVVGSVVLYRRLET
jgi:surfeit locus 1 family protein